MADSFVHIYNTQTGRAHVLFRAEPAGIVFDICNELLLFLVNRDADSGGRPWAQEKVTSFYSSDQHVTTAPVKDLLNLGPGGNDQ